MYPHEIRLRGPWQYRTLSAETSRQGTMTIPGFWHSRGLNKYWGRVELRRNFNWVARLDPDDQVWLVLDKVVGKTKVHLNDTLLGEQNCPWIPFRYDVTNLLAPRNELVVELDAPGVADPHAVYGSLGFSSEDPTPERRFPPGGILGGAHLSVETRRLLVQNLSLQTDWQSSGGIVRLSASWTTMGKRAPVRVLLSLGHDEIYTTDMSGEQRLSLSLDQLPADPWWPRLQGDAQLYPLELTFASEGKVLFNKTWQVGFRRFEVDGDRVWCNDKLVMDNATRSHALYSDKAFEDYFGEERTKPFEQWKLAKCPIVSVNGYLAPESFLRLADRAGLLVEQDVTFLDLDAVSARARDSICETLCAHPSVLPIL